MLALCSPFRAAGASPRSPRLLVEWLALGRTHPRGSGWTPGALPGSWLGRGAAWCQSREASRCQRWEENLQDGEKPLLRRGSPGTAQCHGQPRHPLRVLRRRNDHVTVFPIPFHKSPPAATSHPCEDVTQPWAPRWSFPHHTRRGHQQLESVPTSLQALGVTLRRKAARGHPGPTSSTQGPTPRAQL